MSINKVLHREQYWNPDNVLKHIDIVREEKLQKLEQKRHSKEYEELQECTFQPQINKKTIPEGSSPARPVIVRGLGRFLELKQLAKRQQFEKR